MCKKDHQIVTIHVVVIRVSNWGGGGGGKGGHSPPLARVLPLLGNLVAQKYF